ncbi:MAG: ribosome biogenesis GTPase [Patiriisocius sp.]|jgi:ribosome biogenesis GTPase
MQEQEGTVVKSTGSRYRLIMEDGEIIEAGLKGKFRLEGNRSTNPVAVGDTVLVEVQDAGNVISQIRPRRNHIKRKSINLSKESHVLAANIDLLVLVVTLSSPFTPTEFIDRVLLNAEVYGIKPMLIFNKVDLYGEKEDALYEELSKTYAKIGYDTIRLDALTSDMSDFEKTLKDKKSFFIGQSGVGKSTIINRLLPDLALKTSEVSESFKTGKHTTTFAEMFPLDFGGYIIDSPGVKAFGIIDLDKEEVALYFPEMKQRLDACKFYNCKHINEPKCAVKMALEEGELAASRYKSYVSIFQDCEEENQFRKPDHLK